MRIVVNKWREWREDGNLLNRKEKNKNNKRLFFLSINEIKGHHFRHSPPFFNDLKNDTTTIIISMSGIFTTAQVQTNSGTSLTLAPQGANTYIIHSAPDQIQSLTATQIAALTGMVAGAFVYNSTTSQLNYYSGSTWIAVDSASLGNFVFSTSPDTITTSDSGTLQITANTTNSIALNAATGGIIIGSATLAVGSIRLFFNSTTSPNQLEIHQCTQITPSVTWATITTFHQ